MGFLQSIEVFESAARSPVMQALAVMFLLTWYVVVGAIVAIIALMLLRFILNYADVNPFSRPVIYARRLTDPFVNPVRRSLLGFGIQANGAPLVVVLIAILLGYFVFVLAAGLLNTAAGVYVSLTSGRTNGVIAFIGYVLYGLLTLYGLLITIRIIFSWGRVGHHNRLMRFLMNATDPLLMPLRQMVPPIGMFDISPIVAFIIIWLFMTAIQVTLLRGWPIEYFR
jgi:YggT family protein